MLFHDIAPQFADEIATLLREAEEPTLAEQVPALRVVARCRCGDDFCGSFYTAPPPGGAYGPGHRNVEVDPTDGMVILDVVDDRIMQVEVLYNDEFRRVLHAAMP
jgi:hypothetical protein